ncbi:MAG: flagellar protein FlaG [Proteobacteria bacterium]|nr:flagellar protein FlaG [Pseudomonadota bacterium]
MKVTAIQTSGAYVATASGAKRTQSARPSVESIAPDPAPVLRSDRPTQTSVMEQRDADLDRMVQAANDSLASSDHSVHIEKHDATNRFVMKLVDGDGDVVKQYPSEDFLAVSERLGELRGMLFASEG